MKQCLIELRFSRKWTKLAKIYFQLVDPDMSKQPRTSFESGAGAAPRIKRQDEIVFSPLEEGRNQEAVDLASVLRSINAFKEVPHERGLEGEVKSRIANRMVTLDNMANSEYYVKKPKSLRSNCSKELVSGKTSKAKGLYEFSQSTKYSDFADMTELWLEYSGAFMSLVDAVSQHDCPGAGSIVSYKHSLLVTNLELIGSLIEVADSSNRELIGLSGLVVNEHENTLQFIDIKNKLRLIPKSVCTFRVKCKGRDVDIFGPDICGIGRTGSVYRTQAGLARRRQVYRLDYR